MSTTVDTEVFEIRREHLNAVARSNQAFIYSLFFQTAAAALQKLARDPKFVGGQLGFFGVLALFESGLMPMSLVVSEQAGHNLSAPGGIERLAEAVARGAACNTDLVLDVDFFQHANEPLELCQSAQPLPVSSAAAPSDLQPTTTPRAIKVSAR